MCFERRKALTIEEKRELALAGKSVPICVYVDGTEKRQDKREQRSLAKKFSKNM